MRALLRLIAKLADGVDGVVAARFVVGVYKNRNGMYEWERRMGGKDVLH